MTVHRVTEDQSKLDELIDRAVQGDEVIVLRGGEPVARISGLPQAERRALEPVGRTDADWLARNLVHRTDPKEDAATLVRRMRDEEDE